MRDLLREFIEDYNSGRITIYDLERRLEFDDMKNNRVKALPLDYSVLPQNPADIMEQKERANELMIAIANLKEALHPSDWQLFLLVIKGKKQVDIANKLGIMQGTVSKHLKRIRKAADKLGLQELLHKIPRMYSQMPPKKEYKSPVDIAKRHREGRKTVCRVPEYLQETGCISVCTLCSKCTCKSRNIGL